MKDKTIICIQGDITESSAEAIVNAANNHLWMGAGVAGAIKRKGGEEIEREAISKGPIAVGSAVETTAGKLRQKFVIHAAVMDQDLHTDERKIELATLNSLRLADKLGMKSIDFPALGTGVGGFPVERAAEIMISTARSFVAFANNINKIGFVLFDNDSYMTFKRELDKSED